MACCTFYLFIAIFNVNKLVPVLVDVIAAINALEAVKRFFFFKSQRNCETAFV